MPRKKAAPAIACTDCGRPGRRVEIHVHGTGFKDYTVLNDLCEPCRMERQGLIDDFAERTESLR